MGKFTVQRSEEDYRIVGPDGDEGIMVPYGTCATLCEEPDAKGQPPALYFCLISDPDDENPIVWCVDSVSKVPLEMYPDDNGKLMPYEEVDFPTDVVAAQRALDAAFERHLGDETTIDVQATPEVN
jgi:hypothetical protein